MNDADDRRPALQDSSPVGGPRAQDPTAGTDRPGPSVAARSRATAREIIERDTLPTAPPASAEVAAVPETNAEPVGNVGLFFGPDAYPPSAIRAGAEGRVAVGQVVGPDGRVNDCVVTSSSGNDDLDATTCRIFRARVRYRPAHDGRGNPVEGRTHSAVRWALPSE